MNERDFLGCKSVGNHILLGIAVDQPVQDLIRPCVADSEINFVSLTLDQVR